MRVAIVSESFFPQVNGVTNTVRHVVDRLLATGHEPLIIAPGPGLCDYRGIPVVRTRSVALPSYKAFRVGLPDADVERALAWFQPDVVHLASPFLLGAWGARAARRLGAPSLAVYQTDVGGFARQYGVPGRRAVDGWVGRLHRGVGRTLVPSRSARDHLASLGVPDLHLWGRGVDLDLFGPQHRDSELRDAWLRPRDGDQPSLVVGYVGRLALEKQVRRLAALSGVPGVRLVAVGDGPERAWLRERLPEARLTGQLCGRELAAAFASLDVFVHPGEHETFCQTVQEAQASGVPVVVPAAGGPLDLVEHEVTGLLYDPADPGSLRRTVERAVADPLLRHRLASAGRSRVLDRSWARLVDELVQVHYAELVAARPLQEAA
jgi:phosphatidylinositol alpha 1,6-mannosyltransferase